uniref:Ig-like domain-containing protein n=1 Tax=Scleropages formosus TaxID=113540 RepID=A0A8C9SHM5_SCLFO
MCLSVCYCRPCSPAGLATVEQKRYVCAKRLHSLGYNFMAIVSLLFCSFLVPVSNVTVRANATGLVELNDTVSLTCSASGSSLNFHWFNGSNDITVNERVQLSDENRTLTISTVLRSDKGPLYCVVSNGVSNGTSPPIVLDIRYGPSNISLTVSPHVAAHRAGSDLTLSCSSESNPPALYHQYFWTFNNGINFVGMSSKLTIHYANVSNAGWYTCAAQNWLLNTTSSTNITLNVTRE